MGCTASQHETNPRIFHVWNVDGDGRHLKPGRIEVTDAELVLYQKANMVVRWPLKSLRRYGFDSELFSFECGRRCSTGPGVYAFKCKRAQQLFAILQDRINCSGGPPGPASGHSADDPGAAAAAGGSVDRLPPPPLPNGTAGGRSSPPLDSAGYLQPIAVAGAVPQPHPACPRPNGAAATAGSPGGYVCIQSPGGGEGVEWPAPCCAPGGGPAPPGYHHHHYTNAGAVAGPCRCAVHHHYVNSSAATLALEAGPCPAAERWRNCQAPEENGNATSPPYVNSPVGALSPGHQGCAHCADVNTNYAKLDDLLKQEQTAKSAKERPFYVNVKPEDAPPKPPPSDEALSKALVTLAAPASPPRSYANLSPPTSAEEALEDQVNYAVLDLDTADAGASSPKDVPPCLSREHSLVGSPVRSPEGYAQIDFDKTVALSNSAIPCPFNDDSMRKTRHNAVIPCPSMSA